ncbi:MAG TPA: hypothetical protein VGM05_08395 [Planctomycetaceae bacterium]|jgi:hypothetical protein
MQRLACCSVLVVAVAGCGGSQEAELSKAPDIPNWPGLAALKQEDLLKPILMGAARGNIAMVKEQALNPKFQEAFAKFEAEAMPSKYATPARTAAREEVIKNFKALIEGAKSGASDDDLKAAAMAGNKALGVLAEPASAPAPAAK